MKNMKINPEMVRKVSEGEIILALAGIDLKTNSELDNENHEKSTKEQEKPKTLRKRIINALKIK